MAKIEKYLHPLETARGICGTDGHRYFAFEVNRACNRFCPHCGVRSQYNRDQELTIAESFEVIDKLHRWGFRAGTVLGGEPTATAPFKTKEGLLFYEHTLALVKYSESKGIFTGVSTNGDYFSEKMAKDFAEAGLDWITFSLHTETKQGLDQLIERGQMASRKGIPTIIHTLITKENADNFPGIAAYVMSNGLFVNATIVQEKGGNFSTKPEDSLIPSKEQEIKVFNALAYLKNYGFVRINKKLLLEGIDHYPNSWVCDPERDYFLHVGAGGSLDVCEEVRTDLSVFDIGNLEDLRWRRTKKSLVEKCSGCLYRCYYESENPSIRADFPTPIAMAVIKSGGVKLVEKYGQYVAGRIRRGRSDIDWSLNLN